MARSKSVPSETVVDEIRTSPTTVSEVEAMAELPATPNDIELILSGKPLPIDDPAFPFSGGAWFIKQPDDWLFELSKAVRQAAEAQALNQPEIAAAKSFPPSDAWVQRQRRGFAQADQRIADWEAKSSLTEQEKLELASAREHRSRLIKIEDYSLGQELADQLAGRIHDAWLLRRLIVDEAGNLLFGPDPDGDHAWAMLGQSLKDALRVPLYKVLVYIQVAKNWRRGQSFA